jgi:hypothetical protein
MERERERERERNGKRTYQGCIRIYFFFFFRKLAGLNSPLYQRPARRKKENKKYNFYDFSPKECVWSLHLHIISPEL